MSRRLNDALAGVLLAAFHAAMWLARVPRNFEQARRWC
jgi:hypothetical protein